MEIQRNFRLVILEKAVEELGHPTRSFHPKTLKEYSPDKENRWNCAEFVATVIERACVELGLESPKLHPFTRWLVNTNLGGFGRLIDNGFQKPGDIAFKTNAIATEHIGIVYTTDGDFDRRTGYYRVTRFDLIHSPGVEDGKVCVQRNVKSRPVRPPYGKLDQQSYSHDYHFIRPAIEDPETLWRHETIKR